MNRAITRTIDSTGRVVIPKEFLDSLDLKQKDQVVLEDGGSCLMIFPEKSYMGGSSGSSKSYIHIKDLDKLGRICIPKKWRDANGVSYKDTVVFTKNDDYIVIEGADTYISNKLSRVHSDGGE